MKTITTSPPAPAQSVATSQGTPTPAPWIITENRNLPHRPIEVVGRAGNCCVSSGLGDGPEAAANARLIAAAPELLAMLERVLDGVLRLTELPGTLCPLDIEQALAAIAKAKGGAQ
jgi:hypothetical protein